MATDEYIWDLVLQEAAAGGALDFEYLNDNRQLYVSSPEKATVPSVENLFTERFLDDLNLFDFDDVVTPSFKSSGNDTIVSNGILTEDVGNLADSIFYTNSFFLENVTGDATPFVDVAPAPGDTYNLKLESIASSPDHTQYVADYCQSFTSATNPTAETSAAAFAFEPLPTENNTIAFSDFTPELMNRLLASIGNLPQSECDIEDASSFCDEGVYLLTEESANCSEMDEDAAETDSESFVSEETSPCVSYGRGGGSSIKAGGAKSTDRKKRKMQQNRVAASRYRQKKKAEQDAAFVECEGLEKRNGELKTRVKQMTQEIGYLRGLMADMMKVRLSVKH